MNTWQDSNGKMWRVEWWNGVPERTNLAVFIVQSMKWVEPRCNMSVEMLAASDEPIFHNLAASSLLEWGVQPYDWMARAVREGAR